MAADRKQYLYIKGTDEARDAEFAAAEAYGRVKLGTNTLFWKAGLRWCALGLGETVRIFRQVEVVGSKMCCGRQEFAMERLVAVTKDGTEVVMYLGDDVEPKARALLQALKEAHPELQYGKA